MWNGEIYNLYKDLNIMDNIKIRRLGWAGCIVRMEDERIPKKVPNGKFHNTRLVGKPQTRWTWRHLAAKVGTSKRGGKQWQTIPKNLPRMQRTRAIPVA